MDVRWRWLLLVCLAVGLAASAFAQDDCYVGDEFPTLAGPEVGFEGNDAGIYDPVRNRYVLGVGRTVLTPLGATFFETWSFDGSVWTLEHTTNAIGDLNYSPFAYDSDRGRIMMFGGLRYGPCCGGATGPLSISGDLWEYDGTAWTRVLTMTNTPAPRYEHALAYDPFRRKLVMTGGKLSQDVSAIDSPETWEYDPQTSAWTLRGTVSTDRRCSNMVFSPQAGTMILVSQSTANTLPTMRIYNPSTGGWMLGGAVPLPTLPFGFTANMALVYDTNQQRMLLAGGNDAVGSYVDAYQSQGVNWNPILRSSGPNPGRFSFPFRRGAPAYDPLRRRLIDYGSLSFTSGQSGFRIIWDGLPGIIQQPSAPTGLCTGQDIALGVVGYNAESYQWRRNGFPIPGAVFPSYLKAAATPDDSGTYDCVLSTRCGNVPSAPVPITVATQPTFVSPTLWPGCSTCPGDSMTIIPTQVADPRNQLIVLQKRVGSTWVDLASRTPASLPFLFTSLMRADAGDYRILLRSGCGEFVESTRSIGVGVLFEAQPVSQSIAPCSSATFSVQARGTCISSFQWLKNGQPIPSDPRYTGINTATLTISGCRYEDEGSYVCRVTDTCETANSASAELRLTTPVWSIKPMNAVPPFATSAEYWTAAYDENRGITLLYGGATQTGQNSNSLWEYDGFTWTLRQDGYSAVNSAAGQILYDGFFPPVPEYSAMVYCPDDRKVYLIGPYTPTRPLAIYTWDGTAWSRPYYGPVTGNVGRTHAVWDSINRRIVIVRSIGGSSSTELLTYDPAANTMTGPIAMQPGVQAGVVDSALWFDQRRGAAIWYNNFNQFVLPTMWSLNSGTQWQQIVGNPPVLAYGTPVVYDPVRFQGSGIGGQIDNGSYFTGTIAWPNISASQPWSTLMPAASEWGLSLPDGPPRNPAGAGISPPNNWRPGFWGGLVFDTKRRAFVGVGRSVVFSPFSLTWATYERRYLDRAQFDQPVRSESIPSGVRLSCSTAGFGTVAHQWRRGGVPIVNGPGTGGVSFSGATTPVLTITGASSALVGSFSCAITNACGTEVSTTIVLGCAADFNGVSGLTVQDVFDFLSAWFVNDPRADFNGVGGITVQDVFDFLTAWFAGC